MKLSVKARSGTYRITIATMLVLCVLLMLPLNDRTIFMLAIALVMPALRWGWMCSRATAVS
jgi:hypothetical protein